MGSPLGRSLQDLVAFLGELHSLRIDLFLHQQGLDTTTPAGKDDVLNAGVFAEFERSIIPKRVRAGLRRAKSEGKRLGRPPVAPELKERIRTCYCRPSGALNGPDAAAGRSRRRHHFPGAVSEMARAQYMSKESTVEKVKALAAIVSQDQFATAVAELAEAESKDTAQLQRAMKDAKADLEG
jgi:hypothetical protein